MEVAEPCQRTNYSYDVMFTKAKLVVILRNEVNQCSRSPKLRTKQKQ